MPFNPSKSPQQQFRVLAVVVALAMSVGSIVALKTTGELASTAQNASDQAELAQAAAEASDHLRLMGQILQRRIDEALGSPDIAGLSRTDQLSVEAWLRGESETPTFATVADLPVPLSLGDAVEFQSELNFLTHRFELLTASIGQATFEDISQQVAGLDFEQALDGYFGDPTLGNLRNLQLGIGGARAFTAGAVPQLSTDALTLRHDLGASIDFLRLFVLVLGTGGSLLVLALGFYMSRTTQLLLAKAQEEQDAQIQLTQSLEYRNKQLSALYNVFHEITDTLSLEHVVQATLKESLQIMRAEMSTLRILRGNELMVVGALASTGEDILGLPSVKLGDGPTGRTAKRGRTMRIDSGGEAMLSKAPGAIPGMSPAQQTNRVPMESGLIVPLVVGARVVGTLACWSPREAAFNDEDQRVLEMMASQVATAIAAADTTETSERRAHQDALTSLPNRRQLEEDLTGSLSVLAGQGRNAVVAMLDIDYFKRLNDDFGHQVGDIALQRIAGVLRTSVRDNDHVYRFGGEEFVVVFTDTTISEATVLAERLRTTVMDVQVQGTNEEPVGPITVSIGLALLPEHGDDVRKLIDLADKAMYQAKVNGRNRIEIWNGSIRSGSLTEVA